MPHGGFGIESTRNVLKEEIMSQHATQVQRTPILWVLVADSKQAHVYKYHKTSRLAPLGGGNKHHYYDEKTGHELALIDGDSTAGASFNPKLHDVKNLAAQLGQAHTHKAYDRLVLVAPAKMIGELREHVTAEVHATIAAELHKDLTHYHGQELLAHLQETLNQASIV
jgi:protein required for attachment to host cells